MTWQAGLSLPYALPFLLPVLPLLPLPSFCCTHTHFPHHAFARLPTLPFLPCIVPRKGKEGKPPSLFLSSSLGTFKTGEGRHYLPILTCIEGDLNMHAFAGKEQKQLEAHTLPPSPPYHPSPCLAWHGYASLHELPLSNRGTRGGAYLPAWPGKAHIKQPPSLPFHAHGREAVSESWEKEGTGRKDREEEGKRKAEAWLPHSCTCTLCPLPCLSSPPLLYPSHTFLPAHCREGGGWGWGRKLIYHLYTSLYMPHVLHIYTCKYLNTIFLHFVEAVEAMPAMPCLPLPPACLSGGGSGGGTDSGIVQSPPLFLSQTLALFGRVLPYYYKKAGAARHPHLLPLPSLRGDFCALCASLFPWNFPTAFGAWLFMLHGTAKHAEEEGKGTCLEKVNRH